MVFWVLLVILKFSILSSKLEMNRDKRKQVPVYSLNPLLIGQRLVSNNLSAPQHNICHLHSIQPKSECSKSLVFHFFQIKFHVSQEISIMDTLKGNSVKVSVHTVRVKVYFLRDLRKLFCHLIGMYDGAANLS